MLLCDAHDVNRRVQRRAGVYKLLSRRSSKKFEPFYVGEAEDLQEEMLNHLKNGESNKCIRDTLRTRSCRFRFAYLEPEQQRKGAERFLFDYYKGLCNESPPFADPLEINVA
jgi:hypothetical protein